MDLSLECDIDDYRHTVTIESPKCVTPDDATSQTAHDELSSIPLEDWEEDLSWRLTGRFKGVHQISLKAYARRIMVWEREGEYWKGKWKTARIGRRNKQHIEEDLARAIDSGIAGTVLPEVCLHILHTLICDAMPDERTSALDAVAAWSPIVQNWRRHDPQSLVNFALVCRTWFRDSAPLLYSKILVKDGQAATLSSWLLTSHSRIQEYSRMATFEGQQPWISSAKLARQLSHITWLTWRNREGPWKTPVCYQPSLIKVLSQAHRAFAHIVRLKIDSCKFFSSLDLLALLGSFPALVHVELFDVQVQKCSIAVPHKRSCRLRTVEIWPEQAETPVSAFAYTFMWPRPAMQPRSWDGFLGLPYHEASIIADTLRFVREVDKVACTTYRIDPVHHGHIWIAWIMTRSFNLEFHTTVELPRDHESGFAPNGRCVSHIRWVVIRYHGDDVSLDLAKGLESLREMGESLSRLAYLEAVTIEAKDIESANAIATVLTTGTATRLFCERRTFEQAVRRAIGTDVPHTQNLATSWAGSPAVSPLWYLPRYTNRVLTYYEIREQLRSLREHRSLEEFSDTCT